MKKLGKHVSGGTTIGKHPQTVILDLTYQGSEIYVSSDGWEGSPNRSGDENFPGVKVNGIHIEGPNNFAEFKAAVENKQD